MHLAFSASRLVTFVGKMSTEPKTEAIFFGNNVFPALFSICKWLLVGGAKGIVLALLSYTMGAKRLPLFAIVMSFVALSVLHNAVKAEMRREFWIRDGNYMQNV